MSDRARIGQGTTIRGKITGAAELHIDGTVEGSIVVDGDIEIGVNGRISSGIEGARVTIAGAVLGDVTGQEAIVLESGARVVGDLNAPRIGIRSGGLLKGYVSTGGTSRADSRAQTAKRPAAKPIERRPPPPKPVAKEKVREVEPVVPMTRPSKAVKEPKRAPAPVMPAIPKGAKGAVKKKGAR